MPCPTLQQQRRLTSMPPCARQCALPGACRQAQPRLQGCNRASHRPGTGVSREAIGRTACNLWHHGACCQGPGPGQAGSQGGAQTAAGAHTGLLACALQCRGAHALHAAELSQRARRWSRQCQCRGGAAAGRRSPVHMACPRMPPSVTPNTSEAAARPARRGQHGRRQVGRAGRCGRLLARDPRQRPPQSSASPGQRHLPQRVAAPAPKRG